MNVNKILKCDVSFRIISEKLDPSEITKILNTQPDTAHKKGDPNIKTTKKGKLSYYSPFEIGLWSIDTKKPEYETLENHINGLLTLIEPYKNNIIEFSKKGYKTNMFCGIFSNGCVQPGFDINSEVLKKLGELNISLSVCFY